MASKDRQKALQDWGFNCTCSLCGSGPTALAASDGRRARVQQALSALEDPWLRGSAALVAELADEAEQTLEEEGLAAQKGELHGILAGVYADMGDGETAGRYAASAVEKLAHFAGYDDERTERARGTWGSWGKVGGGGTLQGGYRDEKGEFVVVVVLVEEEEEQEETGQRPRVGSPPSG